MDCKFSARSRKKYLGLIIIPLLIFAFFSMGSRPPPASPFGPAAELVWGPYLTGTSSSGTVINARTKEDTAVLVEYATEAHLLSSGTYNLSATDGITEIMHHIPLSGLEPDTIYHYRLVYGDTATEDYHFRTFPLSGPFTFVVYGDTQDQLPNFSQYDRYKLVADAVAAEPDVAFILSLGDQVNDGTDLTNWDRYFDVSRNLFAKTTIYPLLGNHEKNSSLYYEAFGLPQYYSFDCSDAHFSVLDSNSAADTSAETVWLDSDLTTEKTWKFVAFHHPMYTSDPSHFGGWLNFQSLWEDILIERGVDAVWNGHVHAYEHYLESGIHYLVMGTGGGPSGVLSEEKYTGYQNSLERSLAYAKVTIDPEAGTALVQIMRVADISTDGTQGVRVYPPGTVYDSFTLTHTLITQPDWDLNGDKVCDIGDVVVLGLHWGEAGTPGWIIEDLNEDGVIDIGDVVVLGLHWGQTW